MRRFTTRSTLSLQRSACGASIASCSSSLAFATPSQQSQSCRQYSVQQQIPQGNFLLQSKRFMNISSHTQRKWQIDQREAAPVTDFDWDKENFTKTFRFSSMDCILDQSILPAKLNTITGIKKAIMRWLTMRKLVERRPDFSEEKMKQIYLDYKNTASTRSPDKIKEMSRFTTHAEAMRLGDEQRKRLSDQFKEGTKSWKSLKVDLSKSEYEFELESFEMVTIYLGALGTDEWFQITYKAQGRERESKKGEWEKLVQYPVFELKVPGENPLGGRWIVVAVMNKDGSRQGRDRADAANIRKNMSKSTKWYK